MLSLPLASGVTQMTERRGFLPLRSTWSVLQKQAWQYFWYQTTLHPLSDLLSPACLQAFMATLMDSLAHTAIVWSLPPLTALLPLCLSSSVDATLSTEAGALGFLEAQIWLDQTHRGANFSSAFGLRGSMASSAVKWLLQQLPQGWDIITQKWMGGWHW